MTAIDPNDPLVRGMAAAVRDHLVDGIDALLEDLRARIRGDASPAAAAAAAGPSAEDLEHAKVYELEAARLRRVAKRQEDGGQLEASRESAGRAEYFERRAQHKRAGGVMPPELRTPAENLARVDAFRRAFVSLLLAYGDLTLEDYIAFQRALEARGWRTHRIDAGANEHALHVGLRLALDQLGCEDEYGSGCANPSSPAFSLHPYASPLQPSQSEAEPAGGSGSASSSHPDERDTSHVGAYQEAPK